MNKEEYFAQLYALQDDSSDEEADTSTARAVLRESAKPVSTSVKPASSSSLSSSFSNRSQLSASSRRKVSLAKVPGMHRTVSAPVSSNGVSREGSLLIRGPSKLREHVSASDIASTAPSLMLPPPPPPVKSAVNSTPRQISETSSPATTPKDNHNHSNPTPEFSHSLIMTNSSGIDAMLKKSSLNAAVQNKKKRKENPIKLVEESERLFAGKVFFFIPADDHAPLRRHRIGRARRYGATWAKEWTSEITHIIVDKDRKREQVEALLRTYKVDSIPANTTLVYEAYPTDCLQYRTWLDPNQTRYQVLPTAPPTPVEALEPSKQSASRTIKIAKPRKGEETQRETQRSKESTQDPISEDDDIPDTQVGPSGPTEPVITDTQERSPILDIALGGDSDFDKIIEEARAMGPLPFDDDGDVEPSEQDRHDSSDEHDGSSEEERYFRNKKRAKVRKKKTDGFKDFSCMTGGTGIAENNKNKVVIDILQKMAEYYDRTNDVWRVRAYRMAIGTLKRHPAKVMTYEQAVVLPKIGERLAKKIEEIVLTGRLRRLENAELEPRDRILQLFLKIYGVGTREASKFIQAGYKTLDDLRTKAKLTKNQKIGLEHFDDFDTRIPRSEMTALGDIVKRAAKEVDPNVQAIIGGSYRRGALTSGDIDFIFTKPGTTSTQHLRPFLDTLTRHLTTLGFLTASLATPSNGEDPGSKWHGACVLPGNPIWRRIDFLLVPETEIGAALIYFTGDDLFNRSMRLLASVKGYRLNQRGLYKNVMRGPGRVKVTEGELVEGEDERRIFEILGVPWREPGMRICH